MITVTELFLNLFYIHKESEKGKQMVYKLAPKNSKDVKTLIEANTKKAAICYFAALLHLSQEDLLNIFTIS